MNPRYGTQNSPTSTLKLLHVSTHIISGSIVLYASYMCLSLIYCLTHVECFRFFLAANVRRGTYKLQTTSAVLQASTMASVSSFCKREVGFLGHVTHVAGEITRFEASSQLACDLFATCFRPGDITQNDIADDLEWPTFEGHFGYCKNGFTVCTSNMQHKMQGWHENINDIYINEYHDRIMINYEFFDIFDIFYIIKISTFIIIIYLLF